MSANAEQPGTSTCSCGNVIKIGTIYAESSRGAIECASCGSVAIRWGSPDAEREKRIEAWADRAKAKFGAIKVLIGNGDLEQAESICDVGEAVIDEGLALMRSAPVEPKAEKPEPVTDDSGVKKALSKASRRIVAQQDAAMSSKHGLAGSSPAAGSAREEQQDARPGPNGEDAGSSPAACAISPATDAAIEAAIDAQKARFLAIAALIENGDCTDAIVEARECLVAIDGFAALIARRVAEAGKVNADLLAAAKDLAVKAKAYVDQSWELERLRCDDAVAAFNAAVQRAEEAGRG